MEYTRLGRTGLRVSRTAFGALPIQRVDFDTARAILWRAYEAGVNFFDTAHSYSDSQRKIGYALADVRDRIVIATKTPAGDRKALFEHLEKSLRELKTDRVDILQLHNPKQLPDPDDADSPYRAACEARDKGMVRFVGISNHTLAVGRQAVESGLYDTLQFPLSAISSAEDLALIDLCRTRDIGLIAMKALCGGLITNARNAFAFLRQFGNVAPIWGIQRMTELEEFLALEAQPPKMTDALRAEIERDRKELAGDFCRACGYCLPCPKDIPIPTAARIMFRMRRAPSRGFMTPEFQSKMARIEQCTNCRQCADRCPYNLDTPGLLRKMYDEYRRFVAGAA